MEIVDASFTWGGPESNVLTLYVEPTPALWMADLVTYWPEFIYMVQDENEQETGEVAGVEIVGFLEFDDWGALPELPMLWQFPGWEPLPLEALLKRVQANLRAQAAVEDAVQPEVARRRG